MSGEDVDSEPLLEVECVVDMDWVVDDDDGEQTLFYKVRWKGTSSTPHNPNANCEPPPPATHPQISVRRATRGSLKRCCATAARR